MDVNLVAAHAGIGSPYGYCVVVAGAAIDPTKRLGEAVLAEHRQRPIHLSWRHQDVHIAPWSSPWRVEPERHGRPLDVQDPDPGLAQEITDLGVQKLDPRRSRRGRPLR